MHRLWTLILLAALSLSGCTSSTPLIVNKPVEPTQGNLIKIGIAYSRYTVAKRQPPQGPKDLQPLLAAMGNAEEICGRPGTSSRW